MKLLHKLLGVSNYIEQLEDKLFDKDQYYSNRLIEQKEVNNILNKERNELKLEVHNQQQLINTLLEQINNCNDLVLNKDIELSNLNSYTNKLELKLNKIKVIIN